MKIFIAFLLLLFPSFTFIVLFFLSFLFEVLAWQLISTSGYQVIAMVIVLASEFIMFDVRHSVDRFLCV